MKKLMIWFGPLPTGIDSEKYGCEFLYCIYNPNSFEKFGEILPKAEEYYDAFVIHLDGYNSNVLSWMVNTKRNTNKYEMRMHGSPNDYIKFKNIVNLFWEDQSGWFKR